MSITCFNTTIGTMAKVKEWFGIKMVGLIHVKNNGHPIEYDSKGNSSILFKELEEKFGYNTAVALKARIHTSYFTDSFGDFHIGKSTGELDANGEPKLMLLPKASGKEGRPVFGFKKGKKEITIDTVAMYGKEQPEALKSQPFYNSAKRYLTPKQLATVERRLFSPWFQQWLRDELGEDFSKGNLKILPVKGRQSQIRILHRDGRNVELSLINLFDFKNKEELEKFLGKTRSFHKNDKTVWYTQHYEFNPENRQKIPKENRNELRKNGEQIIRDLNERYPGLLTITQFLDSDGSVKSERVGINENALATSGPRAYSLGPVENVSGEDFTRYQEARKIELDQLRDLLGTLKREYKEAKSPKERVRLAEKRDSTEEKIDFLEKVIDPKSDLYEQTGRIATLSAIYDTLDSDLEEFEEAFPEGISADDIRGEELAYYRQKINLWNKLADFSSPYHILLEESEYPAYQDEILKAASQIQSFERTIYKIELEKVTAFTNSMTGQELTEEEITRAVADVSAITAHTLDISRFEPEIVQAISIAVRKANSLARKNTKKELNQVQELFKKAKKSLTATKKDKDLYHILRQEDENGYTGDIVHPYSRKYLDTIKDLQKDIDNATKREDKAKAIKAKRQWYAENTLQIDYRIAAPEYMPDYLEKPEETFEDYKERLISHAGKDRAEKIIEVAKTKAKDFALERDVKRQELEDAGVEDIDNAMDIWEAKHSPYMQAANDYKAYEINGQYVNPSFVYSGLSIPLRTVERDGESLKTGHYDEKYDIIQKDESLRKLHNHILRQLESTKQYMPASVVYNMHDNELPAIKKHVAEQYSGAAAIGAAMAKDFLSFADKNAWREQESDDVLRVPRDPDTGMPIRKLGVNLSTTQNALQKEMQLIEAEKGFLPQPELVRQARARLEGRYSTDLEAVISAYIVTGNVYRHRAQIEDSVRMAENVVANMKEIAKNNAGDPLSKKGQAVEKEGLTNMKKALSYFMDGFYGMPTRKSEGVQQKKIYTKKELERKKELEITIEDLEKEIAEAQAADGDVGNSKEVTQKIKNVKLLQKEVDKLGGKRSLSRIGDSLLKYFQLKGMGWNFFSSFANIGFGFISNSVLAADGRLFNARDYRRAMGLTLNSIGKNYTFNKIETPVAKKIRTLMDDFDVLKDASEEFYKNHPWNRDMKRVEWMGPYNMQKRSEYVNQAPVMIAILMNHNEEGGIRKEGEKSLWEIATTDGLEMSDEVYTKIKLKIDQANKWSHGNYDTDSPLLLKKFVLLRAASQFRTWAFEGFASRFEGEYFDHTVGMKRKGRYLSLVGGLFEGKMESNGVELDFLQATAYNLKQLMRKLAFQKTQYDEVMSEVDAANMRANLQEFVILNTLLVFGAMLRAAAGDGEDDEYINFLVNQTIRMTTDIQFYFNPVEFEQLNRSFIPAMTTVSDLASLGEAAIKYMQGKDELKSGPFKGESRLWRETKDIVPFATQFNRYYRTTKQMYE